MNTGLLYGRVGFHSQLGFGPCILTCYIILFGWETVLENQMLRVFLFTYFKAGAAPEFIDWAGVWRGRP